MQATTQNQTVFSLFGHEISCCPECYRPAVLYLAGLACSAVLAAANRPPTRPIAHTNTKDLEERHIKGPSLQ